MTFVRSGGTVPPVPSVAPPLGIWTGLEIDSVKVETNRYSIKEK